MVHIVRDVQAKALELEGLAAMARTEIYPSIAGEEAMADLLSDAQRMERVRRLPRGRDVLARSHAPELPRTPAVRGYTR